MSRIFALAFSFLTLVFSFGNVARADVQVAVPGQAYTVWPITVDSPSGPIQIFQPQPESLEGNTLKARAAVSLTPSGATAPVFGALWLTCRVATDRDTRTVTIVDLTVRRVKFPDVTEAQEQQFSQVLQQQIPGLSVTFPLDQLMASLDVSAKEKAATLDMQTAPPRIIYSPVPATLVLIDGQAQIQPVEGQPGLLRVVNTPFIILLDSASRQFFLKAGNFWYSSRDVAGPWQNVGSVPANVLAAGNSLTAPPPAVGAEAVAPSPAQQVNPGQIIVSEEPAELIATNGPPTYVPLAGGDLLYASNTQSDLFMEIATQRTLVLLSGRWYSAPGLQGPWEYVASDKLPAAFAKIPQDSPKANVLASVAGTMDAREAKIEAQIPQTAAVDRNAGQNLSVAYDGQPQFEPIQQTPLSYCVNSPEAVVLFNSRYYCCHQAVWYESGLAAGPWGVCLSVPDAIYTIPPSCPIYNVRFCYVYSSTPDFVYCGYLPGYTGCFIYGPTVVFGTGFYYHGWYHHEYYPRFYTFGFGVRYDRSVGAWGGGAQYRFDRSWFVSSGDHRGWWGPRGYIDYHTLPHNEIHVTNNIIHNTTINRLNIYNRTDNVTRKVVMNRDVITRNEIGHNEAIRHEPVHAVAPSEIHSGRGENNVYAGQDGQVYRRTNDGWEQHSTGGWSKVKPDARPAEHEAVRESPKPNAPPRETEQPRQIEPARVYGGLEADHVARERGVDRTRSNERPQGNARPQGNEGARPRR